MYDDFRGWSGERVWKSDEDELCITATHHGRVELRWDLTARPDQGDVWSFSTTSGPAAGEDIRHLADDFDELLGRA